MNENDRMRENGWRHTAISFVSPDFFRFALVSASPFSLHAFDVLDNRYDGLCQPFVFVYIHFDFGTQLTVICYTYRVQPFLTF